MSEPVYGAPREIRRGDFPAPQLPFEPPVPEEPGKFPIGVIGCGGITRNHLAAYQHAGFTVAALSSRSLERATALRDEFFPQAAILSSWSELLLRDEIRVVDITTHPEVRAPIVEAALRAGKHVLSQKPLAVDLVTARHLVEIADETGQTLAVNQNGRWAPHFAWMREAIAAGLIGDVSTVDFTVHWDHHWICGTAFDQLPDLLLADFAIHWFDLACCFFGDRAPETVFAATTRSRSQRAQPPFLAHACAGFEGGQATFAFNADTTFGQEDRTTILGSKGTLRSVGPGLLEQSVTLHTADGTSAPELRGNWFREGFLGTMAELLCALEHRREPLNSARANLRSLALCLAAVESSRDGAPRRIPR